MNAEVTSSSPPAPCPNHPNSPADYVCGRCRRSVCIECCYSLPDGSVTCKTCYQTTASPASTPGQAAAATATLSLRMSTPEPLASDVPPVTNLPPGAGCIQHPNAVPVAFCRKCGAPSCATCDFVFPVSYHLCPICASSATGQLSRRRKNYLIAAFSLAGWCTLCTAMLLLGAFASFAEDQATTMMLGFAIILFMVVPSLIGTAMGMSALRKGANPMSVWMALVWNSLVTAGLVALIVIGNFRD